MIIQGERQKQRKDELCRVAATLECYRAYNTPPFFWAHLEIVQIEHAIRETKKVHPGGGSYLLEFPARLTEILTAQPGW